MKILAIDTSANACSVALCVNEAIFSLHEIAPMQQTKLILPMIDSLLQQARIKLTDLNALAFGCGPGSFTGSRIAASVIQGLAFACHLPLIKVSSLAGLAQAAYADLGWKKLCVASDARIKEVYWACYEIDQTGIAKLVGVETVCSPQSIPLPEGLGWYGVGNGWTIYDYELHSALPNKPVAIACDRQPMASGVLSIAQEHYRLNDFISLSQAIPVYLRDDVAKKMG
jgi:tRNA threonylcarbamoyladenosine biosynthesis protein TsaB